MGKVRDTSLNLLNSTIGTVVAYNLSGAICSVAPLDNNLELGLTTGLLTVGAILGYKARKIIRKIKRARARNRFLEEVVKDENEDFLERQGIKKGKFGKIRSGLRYLLTVPLGGALGYFPGSVGIIPLCVHFGGYYSWDTGAALTSGPFAGAAIGAYAFGEMTYKKQYERLVTTASALAGASASPFIIAETRLRMYESYKELYSGLGIALGCAAVAGIAGNFIYKQGKKLVDRIRERRNNLSF